MAAVNPDRIHPDFTAHEITVADLKALLDTLRDDDVLVPNRVRNLTIFRGEDTIGFINLNGGSVEMWEQEQT